MAWIIHDSHKAEAAGCDLEMSQALYTLTVQDLADTFNNFHEIENSELEEGSDDDVLREKLSPEQKEDLIGRATRAIEIVPFGWTEAIEAAIEPDRYCAHCTKAIWGGYQHLATGEDYHPQCWDAAGRPGQIAPGLDEK